MRPNRTVTLQSSRSLRICHLICSTLAVGLGLIHFSVDILGQQVMTLKSKTGEVIKGELIKREDGNITLNSKVFGQIVVSETEVTVVTEILREPASKHAGIVVPSKPAQAKQTHIAADHEAKDKTRTFLKLPDAMSVHAGFGLGFIEGHQTDAQNYSGSLSVSYATKRYQSLFQSGFQYGKANGELISETHDTSARTYRYFGASEISPYFAKFKIQHSGDKVHLVDQQSEIFAGLGRDIHKTEKATFRVSVGYISEWEDFSSNPDLSSPDPGVEYRNKGYIHENLDIKLGSKFSLNHDGYFMMEDGEEFEIRLTNGVKYKLTNHLSLDLNYNYTFDDTSPDGIDQDQTQINLQLGYSL
jgi:hypothetical protein